MFSLVTISLALLTTASWTVSFVMPDVFTPTMVLCVTILLIFWDELGVGLRSALLVTIFGTVVMHLTNLPIALGLLTVGSSLSRRELWVEKARYLAILGMLGLGVTAMLAVGVIGFKQWSLMPQSPPFLLARSIEDGPGRLYLRAHCPQIGLEMCGYLDRLDLSAHDFIWDNEFGVYSVVSADQAARLRAESNRVYLAAALEHPWMQIGAIIQRTFEQLVLFTLQEYTIPSSADYNPSEMVLRPWHLPESRKILFPHWQIFLSIPYYFVVIAALVYCLHSWLGGLLNGFQKRLFVLTLAAVLIEALIGGAFSEPSPRYEARVIWLLPALALLFLIQNPRWHYRRHYLELPASTVVSEPGS